MRMLTRVSVAAGLAVLGAGGSAGAQIRATGLSLIDQYWSICWDAIGGLPGSTNGCGSANVVTNPISPPWNPNLFQGSTPIARWIAPFASASMPVATGNGARNYRYYYTQTFNPGLFTTWSPSIGWDNYLFGVFLGGTAANHYLDGTLLFDPVAAGIGNKSGFCRDADGVFSSASWPNCLYQLAVSGLLPNQSNTLTVVLEGDGTTDALMATGGRGGNPITAVPEPATVGLLASGLVVLGVLRRRRAKR